MADQDRESNKMPLDKLLEFCDRVKGDITLERMREEAKRDPELAYECVQQWEAWSLALKREVAYDVLIKNLNDDPMLAYAILTKLKMM